MASSQKADIYQVVTDSIVAMIEAGAGEWQLPWHKGAASGMPQNAATKKEYRGINIPMLWGSAQKKGYSSQEWGTYKQWQSKGAQVRRGERATSIVFWKFMLVQDENAPGGEKEIGFPRWSKVFNADQVDGYEPAPVKGDPIEAVAAADLLVAETGARVEHGGDRAYYRPSSDHIQMPPAECFIDTASTRQENYYSTLLHELTHWTGHKSRLDRLGITSKEDYAREELIAELGAAMLCAKTGVSLEPRPDHAQYLASWLKVLKDDPKAIFTAASKAQKSVDFITGYTYQEPS